MFKITAFVWCYNEENRLANTLKSLKNFDEILVLDKGSTDKSREIAESFGARVCETPYFTSLADSGAVEWVKNAYDSCRNDWLFEVTCSDVYHPDLYNEMIKVINERENLQAVFIPLYRYSMGFVSKYSVYGVISYQRKLFRKDYFDFSITDLHKDPMMNATNCFTLKPKDKKVAIYHLTHENFDMIMERHLRYAQVEAIADSKKDTYQNVLSNSWRKVLGVIYRYIRLGTFLLHEDGKAQFCMWMIYRCTNYLRLYMSPEKEMSIKKKYDEIRSMEFLDAKGDNS